MVGEVAVHLVKEEGGVLTLVDFLGEKAAHPVGKVKGNLEVGVVSLELFEEGDVIRLDVNLRYLALFGGHGSGTALVYPLLDLSKAGVQAHGKGVLTADLHTVVLLGVVGGGNLDGGLVAVVGGAKIHQRSAAEADIVHVCACVRDTFDYVVMDFLSGEAAVTAHQDLVGL